MTLIKYNIHNSTGLKTIDDVQRGENHLQDPLSHVGQRVTEVTGLIIKNHSKP